MLGLCYFTIGGGALIVLRGEEFRWLHFLIPSSIIMYVQVLLSLAIAQKKLSSIIYYACFILFFITSSALLSIYIARELESTFIATYPIVSIFGAIVFIPYLLKFFNKDWRKGAALWKESFSLFYLAIPIRLSVFLVGYIVYEISQTNLKLASDYVTIQIFVAILTFSISRASLLSEKFYFDNKGGIKTTMPILFVYLSAILLFGIVNFVFKINFPLTGLILVVFFITPTIYSFFKQFEPFKVRNIDSTILLTIFLLLFVRVNFLNSEFQIMTLNYAVSFMIVSYGAIFSMRKIWG